MAENFEIKFNNNKTLGVNVSFGQGDALKVPVSMGTIDPEQLADKIADNIDFTAIEQEIQNVKNVTARENTLIQGMGDIIKEVDEVGNKIDNIKLPEIDTTELAKQGENPDATNTKILEETLKVSDIDQLLAIQLQTIIGE
jgi:hypothetical protein